MKTLLKFFLLNYIFVLIELLIFWGLMQFCFLPLGVAVTILGYFISVIGIVVVSATIGMMMSFAQKEIKSGVKQLWWMFPLFTAPGLLSLKYFFANEWSYVWLVSLPALLLTLVCWWIGSKRK